MITYLLPSTKKKQNKYTVHKGNVIYKYGSSNIYIYIDSFLFFSFFFKLREMGQDGRGWSIFSAGQGGGAHTIGPSWTSIKYYMYILLYFSSKKKKFKENIILFFK